MREPILLFHVEIIICDSFFDGYFQYCTFSLQIYMAVCLKIYIKINIVVFRVLLLTLKISDQRGIKMISKLYSKANIGKTEIKNRIIMTAMHTALTSDGFINYSVMEYFRLRARGGAGLIIVGATGIDPVRVNTHNMVQLYNDKFIPGISELASMIHDEGASCFVQLYHPGRYGRSAEYNGVAGVAPSAVPSRFTGETPTELSTAEVEEIISWYVDTAVRAKKAGFDGIEITAASGYLPAQFLSAVTNLRKDRFGGDLEQRMTFVLELTDAVRKAVGSDYPLMFRVGGNDFIPGGNKNADVIKVCQMLEKKGVDAFNITGGWHETSVPQLTMDLPHGTFAYLGRRIKEAVSVPVSICNRMNPETAERLVDEGDADFIGFARSFLADPDFPKKAEAGNYAQIRRCIGCNQACMDHIFYGKKINCVINYRAGRETAFKKSENLKPENAEKIMVIGAGPAGMEFARLASEQGHSVTIIEKSVKTGGQLNIAANTPGRRDFRYFANYLQQACIDSGVELKTGIEADSEYILNTVKNEGFNRVVIAAGKLPVNSVFSTDDSLPQIHCSDIDTLRPDIGKDVVIHGVNGPAIWTSLKLAKAGTLSGYQLKFLIAHQAEDPGWLYELALSTSRNITLIGKHPKAAKDIGPSTRWSVLMALKKIGIKIITEAQITGIKGGMINYSTHDGERSIKADSLIETESFIKNDSLFSILEGKVENLNIIGDASAAGNLVTAIKTANDAAESLRQ